KLEASAATSIAGGFLIFLSEKNWLEAISKKELDLSPTPKFIFVRITKDNDCYLCCSLHKLL
ncbi:hypothetical protein K6V82_08990, partial [Streptococcus gallolyticus]|nr:hypothetical protein [Streptococcus gallolyticus]